jgi:hypothetical protein
MPRLSRATAGRLRAIVVTAVPQAAVLDEQAWRDVEAIIDGALAARPSSVRRQIALFLRLLDLVALTRKRRLLSALSPTDRWQLLDSLSKSKLLVVRRGVWGLRTLAFMGYYARPAAARTIGYRAAAAGWSARRESEPAR